MDVVSLQDVTQNDEEMVRKEIYLIQTVFSEFYNTVLHFGHTLTQDLKIYNLRFWQRTMRMYSYKLLMRV